MDLSKGNVKLLPTWIKIHRLPLQYWGQVALYKIARLVGTPIRTARATAQKDILEFARILVEVSVDKVFQNEIVFFLQ